MKHQKIRGKWYLAGLAVCVLLFGVSLFQVISHYAGAQKAEEEFTKLAEIVEQTEDMPEKEPAGEEQEVISPLERYAELFSMTMIWPDGFRLRTHRSTIRHIYAGQPGLLSETQFLQGIQCLWCSLYRRAL